MKWTLWLSSLLVVCIVGCATTARQAPPPTVAEVELDRYAGTWLEVARLPTPFQKPEERGMAQYTVVAPDKLRVVNTGLGPGDKIRKITGSAQVVPGSNGSKLRVRFDEFPASLAPVPDSGNYWILALDTEYRYAMVGTPNRKYLWLLSRTEKMPEKVKADYVSRAKELGYETDRLLDY